MLLVYFIFSEIVEIAVAIKILVVSDDGLIEIVITSFEVFEQLIV